MSTAKNESPQLKYTGVEINFVINNLEAERTLRSNRVLNPPHE